MTNNARPKRILLAETTAKELEKHAYSNLEAEVGGMLFGEIKNGKTDIIGFVPALKATTDQVSLTFTHEVWEDILKKGEQKFPQKQIVGWYHTHPSFGIFLSDYDQFIQNNFFDQAGQVALVIDPIAGRLGWFEKKGEKIVLLSEENTLTGPKKAKEARRKNSGNIRNTVLAVLTTSVITAAATFGIATAMQPPNLAGALRTSKAQLEEAKAMLTSIQEELGYINGTFSLSYTVRKGDTFESIAAQFYQTSDASDKIKATNPKVKKLEPGVVLLIVEPVGMNLAPYRPEGK